MGKVVAAFATSYFVLVLLKDGTLPTIVQDAAKGASDLAKGLKPITQVG
jgi:hypothetical protein